jgi:hypothetical protein
MLIHPLKMTPGCPNPCLFGAAMLNS